MKSETQEFQSHTIPQMKVFDNFSSTERTYLVAKNEDNSKFFEVQNQNSTAQKSTDAEIAIIQWAQCSVVE